MWVLVPTGAYRGPTYRLKCGVEYSLGRLADEQNKSQLLFSDKRISRKHATLRIEHLPSDRDVYNVSVRPAVRVRDASKCGTLVNNMRAPKGKWVPVKEGDVLGIGSDEVQVVLRWEGVVVSMSGVSAPTKRLVLQFVAELGGHVSRKWTAQCTHLVAEEVSGTTRVLDALCDMRPLVMYTWLQSISTAHPREPLPEETRFLPPIKPDTAALVDARFFHPIAKRAYMFSNMNVVMFAPALVSKLRPFIEKLQGCVVEMLTDDVTENAFVGLGGCLCVHTGVIGDEASYDQRVHLAQQAGCLFADMKDITVAIIRGSVAELMEKKRAEAAAAAAAAAAASAENEGGVSTDGESSDDEPMDTTAVRAPAAEEDSDATEDEDAGGGSPAPPRVIVAADGFIMRTTHGIKGVSRDVVVDEERMVVRPFAPAPARRACKRVERNGSTHGKTFKKQRVPAASERVAVALSSGDMANIDNSTFLREEEQREQHDALADDLFENIAKPVKAKRKPAKRKSTKR